MKNKKAIFSAVIAMMVMGVSVFYACKKDTLQNGQSEKNRMSSTGNTQIIDIQTYINIGTATYPVTGNATASHIDGRIYGCNLTWTMPLNEANVVGMHFVATLKPEFEDLAEDVESTIEHYDITINEQPMSTDGFNFEIADGVMITISYQNVSELWNRVVVFCEANIIMIGLEPIVITSDFSSIDISKISYEDGMLVFESLEFYAQTLDALVEICNQYSNNYVEALEERLGCSIDNANEDLVEAYVLRDNFFPYNPLMGFLQLIGFTNSAYPMLRAQEIEWLATSFETEENPFDAVGVGYVESALHNCEGCMKIKTEEASGIAQKCITHMSICGFTINFNTNPNKDCGKRDKVKEKDFTFYYSGKTRQIRGILATTGLNIRGKTTAWYKNNRGTWISWWTRVDVKYGGQKWTNCEIPHNNISTGTKTNHALLGLVETYATFKTVPTYIIPDGNVAYITGEHWCSKNSGKAYTEIRYSN